MNRNEEYLAMLEELERPVSGLETTLERACKKKRKRTARMIVRPVVGLAACFALFILLVNFSAPVANACARIPVLRELAEAVSFSRSLTDAVENEYVQTIGLSQTENGITAQIDYLIVDQKQVNVFYRLDSDRYTQLAADPDIRNTDGGRPQSCSYGGANYVEENGELRCLNIDFVDGNVPGSLVVQLKVYTNQVDSENLAPENSADAFPEDTSAAPDYLAEFEFLLEFDPQFTASGKVFPVNQTVTLDGQAITITDIEVYPTHMRVNIQEDAGNTAWLQNLNFYIEADEGMRFDPVSNGITATGTLDSPSMVSYRADSTYFYEASHLKLVITGAKWLRKDMQTTYVNLVTGQTGPLPEGAVFDSARKQGDGWVVTFRADWDGEEPMYQLFRNTFYDADGNAYEINMWSDRFGAPDENGKITYFSDEFPLKDYPYEEVWLSPLYSHCWTAENQIVIMVQ